MFLMLSSASANSQGTETPEIALGFKMGEIKGFTPDQHMLLKSKVIEAVTSHQAGIYDYNLHFYLQPEFAIISKKTADGGLRKIEVVNAKLLLSIKNAMNHQIVAATSIAIQGSGISEQEALTAAVNAIEPDAPVFLEFLTGSKEKIAAYYKSQCSVIISDLDVLLTQKNYEVALVRLGTMPKDNTSCNEKLRPLRAKLLELYRQQAATKVAGTSKNEEPKRATKTTDTKAINSKSEKRTSVKEHPKKAETSSSQSGIQRDQSAFSNIATSSNMAVSGNADPVRSIAAAILATRQVR
jgi:hypothetical protein